MLLAPVLAGQRPLRRRQRWQPRGPSTTFVLETYVPGIRGLSYGGADASAFRVGDVGQTGSSDTFWRVDLGTSAVVPSRTMSTKPYVPFGVGWSHVDQPPVVTWDDFWLFPKGGHAAQDPVTGSWRAAWWSAGFPNLVQQLAYGLQPTPLPTALWSTTDCGHAASIAVGTGGSPPLKLPVVLHSVVLDQGQRVWSTPSVIVDNCRLPGGMLQVAGRVLQRAA